MIAVTAESVASEIRRRQTRTERVLELFQARLNQWIDVHDLASVGGFSAWRTRVSEARELAEQDGFTIEWNHKLATSAYRLIRKPLGPDASSERTQKGLF